MSTSAKANVSNDATRRESPIGRTLIWLSGSLIRIAVLYLASLVVASLLFWVTEDYTLEESFYWSYVTALSIGYGDISPQFLFGRLLVFFFGHIWIYFIGALIIANIIERVRRDRNQLTHEEQEWIMDSLQRIAQSNQIKLAPLPHDTLHGNVS